MKTKAGLDISIVILSYNTKITTEKCIQKTEAAALKCEHVLGNKVRIIVVDNNSSDGTQEMIRKNYPGVLLSAQKVNTGVGLGYNIGMRMAKTPFILIMNSDLYLKKDTVLKSLKYLLNDKTSDVLICNLVDSRGRIEQTGGHLPTPFRTIRWLLGFESLPLLKKRIKRIYQYNDDFYSNENDMEWAPTCFFFMRRKVFEVTKGNDENLFLYMEDVEWSKRINENGFKIRFTPKFTAIHLGGMSSDKKMPSSYILKRQVEGLKYYQKKHHAKTYMAVLPTLFLGFGLRSFYFLIRGDFARSSAYIRSLTPQILN